MVLDKSDYSLPQMGESYDPTDPVGFVSRLAGLVIALGVVVFAFNLSRNRVAPLMNSVASSLTGGLVDSDGGDIEVF